MDEAASVVVAGSSIAGYRREVVSSKVDHRPSSSSFFHVLQSCPC